MYKCPTLCYNEFMNIALDLKKILDNLDKPLAVCDFDQNILYANKAFLCLFKLSEIPKSAKISDFFDIEQTEINISSQSFEIKIENEKEYNVISFEQKCNNHDETYSDFISTVSHELRTPLTSIRGFADTMLFSYEKLDASQIQRFLSIIKEQSNRLIKLIENLLSISKMQSQNENFVYKSVNIKAQIEQILLLMKNQYKTHHFVFDCAKDSMPVLVDECKFQQIIINLLDNASKYSPEGSRILINVQNNKHENFARIIVEDEGIGIAPESISGIFEKFARVENHLTRKAQGSGLGLYIVKNLVEKMGGKISVESELSKGSAFCVEFPCADYTTQSGKKISEVL